MFELSDDFEVPPGCSGGAKRKFPLYEMKVGQSFEVPLENLNSVRGVAQRLAREQGKKFTVRKMPDNTHRCWRTK